MKLTLDTERLILRPWRDSDRVPFAALNADPKVMEFFPSVLTRQESDAQADRIEDHFVRHGFGMWAVEVKGHTPFAGFIGLAHPSYQTHFTPCVEIGWRLAPLYWGKGYATEGARRALQFGFDQLGLEEIVSFTAVGNIGSRRVMETLGMQRNPEDDFDHPLLAKEHPLCRHVLYRLKRQPVPATAPCNT
ncbi:MAG: GNAT family N-acetyltransferase [Planctomycetia bacterium]|nr:GNAT family N-acetyltransferase [Planctomycetia bacterium]